VLVVVSTLILHIEWSIIDALEQIILQLNHLELQCDKQSSSYAFLTVAVYVSLTAVSAPHQESRNYSGS